jgi:hypothetical protein
LIALFSNCLRHKVCGYAVIYVPHVRNTAWFADLAAVFRFRQQHNEYDSGHAWALSETTTPLAGNCSFVGQYD